MFILVESVFYGIGELVVRLFQFSVCPEQLPQYPYLVQLLQFRTHLGSFSNSISRFAATVQYVLHCNLSHYGAVPRCSAMLVVHYWSCSQSSKSDWIVCLSVKDQRLQSQVQAASDILNILVLFCILDIPVGSLDGLVRGKLVQFLKLQDMKLSMRSADEYGGISR